MARQNSTWALNIFPETLLFENKLLNNIRRHKRSETKFFFQKQKKRIYNLQSVKIYLFTKRSNGGKQLNYTIYQSLTNTKPIHFFFNLIVHVSYCNTYPSTEIILAPNCLAALFRRKLELGYIYFFSYGKMMHGSHSRCRLDELETGRNIIWLEGNAFIFKRNVVVFIVFGLDKWCSCENGRLKELLGEAHA